MINATRSVIEPDDLPEEIQPGYISEDMSEDVLDHFIGLPLEEIEKMMINQTLEKTEGNRTHAAKLLCV